MAAIVQTNTSPKYRRIAAQLRGRIAAGELRAGTRLPGEHDLAEQHGVHRLTARRALDELAREGLLDRTPGRGTFVAARPAAPRQLGTNQCVGLAVRASGHFFANEAQFLIDRLQRRGLLTILLDLSSESDSPPAADAVPLLRQALCLELAAVVIDGGFLRRALEIEPDLGGGRPVIVMNRLTEDPATLDRPTLHSVTSDFRPAGRMVARHLLDQGHRRLLFCGYGHTDPQQPWALRADADWSEREFLAGCRDALAECGLDPADHLRHALNVGTVALPQPDLGAIFAGREPPTAVICLNDFRARMVYDVAAAAGLRIGRDIAVVGVGNTPWATTFRPRLSSLDLCPERLATDVDELIARLMDSPRLSPKHLRIRPRLVIRESSAGCGKGGSTP